MKAGTVINIVIGETSTLKTTKGEVYSKTEYTLNGVEKEVVINPAQYANDANIMHFIAKDIAEELGSKQPT